MKFYAGLTDKRWFDFLRQAPREDVNFWRPLGSTTFGAIPALAPFLFKLKAPHYAIGGVGFFSNYTSLPASVAWDVFRERNGYSTYEAFLAAIQGYRRAHGKADEQNPTIGCIVLTAPVFFNESEWVPAPEDWRNAIVTGKTYDSADTIGGKVWAQVEQRLSQYRQAPASFALEPTSLYKQGTTKVRIGQGAFRTLVTDAYERRCAISGERTLPVLEAAHIKPYKEYGPNETGNGLLLRSDLHKLFDNNYLTVDATDKRVLVSSRIREEFSNGKEYYRFHGQPLVSLPKRLEDKPTREFLEFHNARFRP